jgi:hypothetical protein
MHTRGTLCIPNADVVHTKSNNSACAPALSKVIETLDHGAVTVHPDRPSVTVFLVQLPPDTAQEHHAPVPVIVQGGIVELDAGSLQEWERGNEEDVVHPHLLVVDACKC